MALEASAESMSVSASFVTLTSHPLSFSIRRERAAVRWRSRPRRERPDLQVELAFALCHKESIS